MRMPAMSPESTSSEMTGREATDYAYAMAQSVLTLGRSLADTYTEIVSALPGDLHGLIAHVEQAISALSALPGPTSPDDQGVQALIGDLTALLSRLTALTN